MLIFIEKAFRISCTIRIDSLEILIGRKKVQTDQNSDMNIIFMKIIRKLCLKLFNLNLIEFRDLIMRTADHKKIFLLYWVWFDIEIQKIWKKIKCFVSSRVIFISSMKEFISLLLNISWLYSVNATISIRESKIEIENSAIDEKIKAVQGFLLTFSSEHEILMHSIFNYKTSSMMNDQNYEISESDNFEFENDFFDLKDFQ